MRRRWMSAGLMLLALGSAACAEKKESCVACHSYMRMSFQKIVTEWEGSIHAAKGVGCADCHGGNPRADRPDQAMARSSGYIGVPDKKTIPALCARCHADPNRMRPFNIPTDQYAQYQLSVHGRRLLIAGDRKAAACTDCHGAHDIRAKTDPASKVFKRNIPETCGRCHANQDYMAEYGIPTDQVAEYKRSIHGRKLLAEGQPGAPACADCHGIHGATPPGVTQIPDVCGQCHAKTEEYFNKGPHRDALLQTGVPRCVSCHGNHEIRLPGDEMLIGSKAGHCGGCHGAGSEPARIASSIHRTITETARALAAAVAALDSAENRHMDVSEARVRLEGARTGLIEARALQHMANLTQVRDKTSEALGIITEVRTAAREAHRAADRRRRALISSGLFLLLAAGVLLIKWRQVAKTP